MRLPLAETTFLKTNRSRTIRKVSRPPRIPNHENDNFMSSNRTEALVDKVTEALGDHILEVSVDREEVSVTVKPNDILTCSRVLFDDPGLSPD